MSSDDRQEKSVSFQARLEREGELIPLSSPFNIGRYFKCSYIIPDTRVSRVHTLLQFDQAEEHWLISDVGSTNGTYLNGVRIVKPEVLKKGDEVRIGDLCFVFEEDHAIDKPLTETDAAEETLLAVEAVPCWLLVADIEGSTRLSQKLPQSELSAMIRVWAGECEALIGRSGGVVNEFTGDGLLAFWRAAPEVVSSIADLLKAFHALESESGLRFRVIVHHGTVDIGGGVSSGVEKLAGRELNFIFKIEKAAGRFGSKVTLTQSARDQLNACFACRELGEYKLDGFDDRHQLFAPVFRVDNNEMS